MESSDTIKRLLLRGLVIPASPLALDQNFRLDERRQRAVWRYYADAGAGGVAVGVHTTQFAIRDPKFGLFEPVLALGADEFDRADRGRSEPLVRVAGICGETPQAAVEAALARRLRYHAGLLNLSALRNADDEDLVAHCRTVGEILPIFGFYLQPAMGGRLLSYAFWRQFFELPAVVAIKIAAFNRYQTLDVVRAVAESGREDVAVYTGNDDTIVLDLLTPYCFPIGGRAVTLRIVGGLLGHWAVWTRRAVELLHQCHAIVTGGNDVPLRMLQLAEEVTDANAAVFDAAWGFNGCVPGIQEVLRRQGLLEAVRCLDSRERLSPGQAEEIDRVSRMYPHLTDDEFVAAHREEWLAP